MPDWWLRRVEGFIDNILVVAAFGLVAALAVAAWAVVQELPAVVVFGLGLVAFVAVEWGVLGLRFAVRRAEGTSMTGAPRPHVGNAKPEPMAGDAPSFTPRVATYRDQNKQFRDELDSHLSQINRMMDEHGFGPNPYVAEASQNQPPTFEFWHNRQSVQWYVEQLQLAGRASVLWHSGSVLRDYKIIENYYSRNLSRVVLPFPAGVAFELLAVAADDAFPELAGKVKDVARDALNKGVEVRFNVGLSTNLITLCEQWVMVESFLPFLPAGQRPTYRVWKRGYPDLYQRMADAYEEIWRHVHVPSEATLSKS